MGDTFQKAIFYVSCQSGKLVDALVPFARFSQAVLRNSLKTNVKMNNFLRDLAAFMRGYEPLQQWR